MSTSDTQHHPRRVLGSGFTLAVIIGGGGAVARACIKGVVIVILLYVFLVAALAWKVPLASLAGVPGPYSLWIELYNETLRSDHDTQSLL